MINSARIFLVESLETRFVWIQKSSFQAFFKEYKGRIDQKRQKSTSMYVIEKI